MHHLFFCQLIQKVDQQVKPDQELPGTSANNSDPFLLSISDTMAVGCHISILSSNLCHFLSIEFKVPVKIHDLSVFSLAFCVSNFK